MNGRSNFSWRHLVLTRFQMRMGVLTLLDLLVPFQRPRLNKVVASLLLAGLFLLCLIPWVMATPVGAAGISVWKTASADPVKAGEPFTYTIHVSNSTGNQINLVITDEIPAGATVVNPGSGTLTNGVMRWSVPAVDHGSTIEVSFAVAINQAGQVVNANYQASSTPNFGTGNPLVTTIIPNDPAVITLDAAPNPTTVGSSTELVITVKDAYGNPVADGTNVSINFDKGMIDGQSAGTPVNGATSGGQVVKTLSAGTVAGTAHVVATTGGIQKSTDVIFQPGPAAALTVAATPASIPANGSATASISVNVRDSYGNPVAQTPLTITTSLGQLNGSGTTLVTHTDNGQVIANLSGTVAGLARLTVTLGSLVDTTQSVYLAPGPPTHLSLQANPASITADGASNSTITLLVLDEYDNRVDATVPVTITTSRGKLAGGAAAYTETTNDGEVQIPLTSITQAGTASISASAWGLNTATSVDFVPGPPAQITLDTNPLNIPGDGTSTTVLMALVRDTFGNPVNTPVAVTFAAGSGTLLPDNGGSTINGVITRTLRSSTILGAVPLTATAAGLGPPAIGSVNFTVGPPHTADVSLSPTSPITAGTPATLTVTVRDSVGHVVPGVAITVTSGLGTITPNSTGITDENGQLQRTLLSTRTGPDMISISSTRGVLDVSGGSLSFKPDLPVQAVLTAYPTQLFANGTTTAVVTATLKDQYGNVVPGVVPNFTNTLGTLSGDSQTNASGVVTRILQSTTQLGTTVLSISGLLTVTNASVDFVTGPPAIALLDAQPSAATANGTDRVTLVITVTDSIGHPIVGQTLAVTSSIGTVSGSGPTNSEGVLSRNLTSTRSGQPQIYVAGIAATGNGFTFLPGPLHRVAISPYGSFTSTVAASAGDPLIFTATGYDFYNNPIAGLSFGWSKAVQGGDGLMDAGGTFTGTLVGTVQVKATHQPTGKTGVSFVTVGPGTAAQATLTAQPDTLPADGLSASALTFYVKDIYGNAVAAGVPLTVTGSIGIVRGSSPTGPGGIASRTIDSTQAGQATIGVTNLITITGDRVITFTPGIPYRAYISASPALLPANGVATSILSITLLDRFDNPVGAGFNPVVQAGLGTISGNGTTNASGLLTRTLTAPLQAGQANFVIRYNNVLLPPPSGDNVSYTVDVLDHVVISPNTALNLIAGQSMTFTARAYDKDNAPIPDGVTYGWSLNPVSGDAEQNLYFGPEVTITGTLAGNWVELNVWAVEDQTGSYDDALVYLTVLPGLPAAGTVTLAPATITADGVSPITFTLTNLIDSYGNMPADGAVLTVTLQSAPLVRLNTGAVNNGEANISMAATTQAGTYPFSVSTSAGPLTLDGPTHVSFIPGPPAQAEVISFSAPAVIANGTSTTTVRLQLRDAYGNKVASGLTPVVTATLGTVLPGGGPTDGNGVLTRTLQAGLVVGEAQLCITGFAAYGPTLALIPGPPVTAQVTVITSTLAAGGSSTPVTFDVRDAWNHPVADGTIITPTLTPAYGTFSGARLTVGGVVQQTLTPGTSVGTATVSSSGISTAGDTLVTFLPGPAALAHITASPTWLKVDGTTSLTITVTDAYGNIVPPTLITVTAIPGNFNGGGPTFSQTTSSGAATITATLTSTTAGTETLILSGPAGPLTILPTSDDIFFMPEEALTVTLNPPGPITATAGVTLTVTASSRDRFANAVDPWAPVDYTWWQSASPGAPGFGLLTPADGHARSIGFKPIKVGPNLLWATGGITTSNVLTVNVVAGPPASATLAISPTILPAGGVSTYGITLTNFTDAFGNAIPDGAPLTVTVQSVPPVVGAGTTMNGVMTGILPTSTDAGTHPVVVTGPGGPLTLSGDTSITFTPGPPTRAFITATPKTIPADGMSTTDLSLTIRDAHSNLVADGTPITVTASAGVLSGSGATTNGQVTQTLRAPIQLGTAQFTVESSSGPLFVSGDTVEFVPGPPAQALVTATPAQVLADGSSLAQISVTIKDGYGFTIPGNGSASLSVNHGSLLPTTTVVTAGSFTATFTAGTSLGLAGLSVAYNGVALPAVGDTLELIPGPPVTATISANPASLVVGSSQQSLLKISLADAWGHPVADGQVVTVTSSLGSILPDSSTTQGGMVTRALTPGLTMGTAVFTVTTSAGTLSSAGDRVTLTSGVLDHIALLPIGAAQVVAGNRITFTAKGYDVFGNETGTGVFTWRMWPHTGYGTLSSSGVFTGVLAGEVGIQAAQGTVYSQIKDVIILPDSAITAVVRASPITIPVGGATSTLTITARDSFGNVVANGTALTVTTNLGSMTGSSTTQNGVLTRTLTSGSYYGVATVVVNGFEAGGDKVSFIPRSRLTANPSSLYADGFSQTTLTVEVFDVSGLPVADGTKPKVTASLGLLDCDENGATAGRLTCTLQAPLTPGTARVYVDNLLVEGSVPFLVGPAAVARVTANPPWLMADGASRSTLTLKVEDAYGHVITNAGPLTVTTSLGTISSRTPTVNGVTTRVLTAGAQSGAALISVAGLSTTGDSKVHLVGPALQDSSFESGGLNNWSLGRVTTLTANFPVSNPAYSATVISGDVLGGIAVIPPSGSEMVRLGATTNDKTPHQLSEVWLSQPVYVQPSGLTQVTFLYRILSYDVAVGSLNNGSKEWDPFEVYLNNREVFQDGFRWSQEWENWYRSDPTIPKDMGWKQGVLDLSPYAGQVVTLQFRLSNRQWPQDNTWVYLDSLNLKFLGTKVHQTFLPVVLR